MAIIASPNPTNLVVEGSGKAPAPINPPLLNWMVPFDAVVTTRPTLEPLGELKTNCETFELPRRIPLNVAGAVLFPMIFVPV